MARRDDLAALADRLTVPFLTIQEIIDYMDKNDIEYAAQLEETVHA
jgi:3,4-dihydroxy 2-butanone 4-phosphate synthase/GTP cyclohydrolase II